MILKVVNKVRGKTDKYFVTVIHTHSGVCLSVCHTLFVAHFELNMAQTLCK